MTAKGLTTWKRLIVYAKELDNAKAHEEYASAAGALLAAIDHYAIDAKLPRMKK